jgi:hypothetical protein
MTQLRYKSRKKKILFTSRIQALLLYIEITGTCNFSSLKDKENKKYVHPVVYNVPPLMGAYQIIITRRFTNNVGRGSHSTMHAGKLIRTLSAM